MDINEELLWNAWSLADHSEMTFLTDPDADLTFLGTPETQASAQDLLAMFHREGWESTLDSDDGEDGNPYFGVQVGRHTATGLYSSLDIAVLPEGLYATTDHHGDDLAGAVTTVVLLRRWAIQRGYQMECDDDDQAIAAADAAGFATIQEDAKNPLNYP